MIGIGAKYRHVSCLIKLIGAQKSRLNMEQRLAGKFDISVLGELKTFIGQENSSLYQCGSEKLRERTLNTHGFDGANGTLTSLPQNRDVLPEVLRETMLYCKQRSMYRSMTGEIVCFAVKQLPIVIQDIITAPWKEQDSLNIEFKLFGFNTPSFIRTVSPINLIHLPSIMISMKVLFKTLAKNSLTSSLGINAAELFYLFENSHIHNRINPE